MAECDVELASVCECANTGYKLPRLTTLVTLFNCLFDYGHSATAPATCRSTTAH